MITISKKKTESKDVSQPHTYIDKTIHEPARLIIMSYLYVVKSADFVFLRNQTGLTDGNLSSHLNKLESTGYIEVEKKFKGKIPQTIIKLNKKGRDAIDIYREKIEKILSRLDEKG